MATGRLFLLKEKSLGTPENHDWTSTKVNLWLSIAAPMLLSRRGLPYSYNSTSPRYKIVDGNIDDLNAALYEELLAKIDFRIC
jgi:hypothetical protein